ncbi:MAG: hypothetical protein KAG89_14860 [Fulvimarina manganoxydans]|uniref:hypothetical protein n=1 Tax=Fulvimarina manganoxydans TaxID=937218 RepID=UPI002356D963|nr:hypothetical protein [Fulvimarina manganoxydans]MCK5933439.1 hypothetical protein [Fulvimarina manganoxydans]
MKLAAQLDFSALSRLAAGRASKTDETGDGDDKRWMKGLPKTSAFRALRDHADAAFGLADPFDEPEAHTIA